MKGSFTRTSLQMHKNTACRKVMHLEMFDQIMRTIIESMKRQLMERAIGDNSDLSSSGRQKLSDRCHQQVIEFVEQATNDGFRRVLYIRPALRVEMRMQ